MPVTGQLWWTAEGDPSDVMLVFINSDGSNQTVEADNDPAPELITAHVQDVGLDTAAGWFFAIVNDGPFGNGARLVRGQIGGSGAVTVVADFQVGSDPGDSNFDDIIVNALHVDNINEKIYVSYQDPFGDASNTGIRQFGYDPLTGAVVDEGFLVRADLETNKEIDPDNFGLDTLNVRDFDLDLSSNTLYFTELFTGGLQEQGLYRMDLTTKVITQMVSSLQFPDEGTNGYIIDVEVDASTDLVYFTTESQQAFGNPGYNAAQNGIWFVAQGATDAVATQLTLVGLPVGSHLYPGDMVIDQDSRRLYVESEEEDGVADDVIYVFQLDATGTIATLVDTFTPSLSSPFANIQGMAFNALPHLTGLAGTPAAAAEQGAAVTLLTAAPAIADMDGDHLASATVQITGGTFISNENSADDDDLGIGAGLQQSGLVAGTNITVSWNQATSTLTLTGYDTLDNYEAVLAMVHYRSTGDNPTNYGDNPTRTITWTVSDGALGIPGGQQNSGTTTLTIAASNDAPVNTTGGPIALLETDPPAAVTGLSVSDVDADPATDAVQVTLSVTLGAISVATGVPGGITAGQVTGNGTNSVTVTATQNAINATFAAANGVTYAPGASGVDTLTMTTSDLGNTGAGGAQQDSDLVLITVINVNDAPTAPATNSVSTAEDNVSAATAIGATDPDGDTLTYSEKPGFGAANGTVTFNQTNGTFTYAPDPDFNGTDSFTILIDDGNGGTAEQAVSVTVTPVNDAPTAPAANSVTTAEDSASAATSIAANDVDGDTLTYSTKPGFGPANGSVSYNQGAGTFTYTPAANFNGSDSFTIVVDDGNGGTTEQVVSVTVTPVNDAPTAPATNSVTTAEDTASAATEIDAEDIDGDSLTYSEKPGFGAANGTVTFNNTNGTFVYTPDIDFHGTDSFTILVDDGNGGTAEQDVSVTVTPVNDNPTGVSGTLNVHEFPANGTAVGTLVGQDPDSSSFTYQLLNDAGGRFAMDNAGNVTVADGLLIDFEQQNSHTITVRVTDDQGAYADFNVNVSIADVLGENVTGDGRNNYMVGGAESDTFNGVGGNDLLLGGGGADTLNGGLGNDSLLGGAGSGDILLGGDGDDWLDGGAGADTMTGGAGNDVFVFTKGEANGDVITDFFGQGNALGDSIVLAGYGAGTTFTRVGPGSSNLYKIDDNGFIEFVTIYATGQVHGSDYDVVTSYDYDFWW